MQVARTLRGEWRTAEEHVGMCPLVGDNGPKGPLSPHTLARGKAQVADGAARGPSGRWWGNGLPSR
jgi:hypothetical protein